ncbi:MAG: adenylate kinase, partial [Acidimicrobiales bacterium]|nr:adenylate kinase [Acidimicrobiales bacterium]
MARAIAAALDVPHLELDAVRHQPGWQELPDQQFCERVAAVAAGDAWVVDGNYSQVREPIVWPQADTVIWLDLPRRTVMRQVSWRSVQRVARREELWNGNRESWRNLVAWDPYKSIIRWAWTRHPINRARYHEAMHDPSWAALTFVRLESRRDVTTFLTAIDG